MWVEPHRVDTTPRQKTAAYSYAGAFSHDGFTEFTTASIGYPFTTLIGINSKCPVNGSSIELGSGYLRMART